MADQSSPTQAADRWGRRVAAGVAGVLLFSLVFGLIILPVAQAPHANISAWTAICRAVGIQPGTPAQPQPPVSVTAAPVSQVRWTPQTLRILASADPRPGAALAAAVCSSCHGQNGISTSADFPRLAAQSAMAVYKQISDYRSGARASPLMAPIARQLTDTQMSEVAVYFSASSERNALGPREEAPDDAIARLTRRGDPARRLPPCEGCHARGVGGPPEAPVLTGQWGDYITRQLQAYRTGGRRNDVYRRMRDIAAMLTDDEMKRLGKYYQGLL
jgi:cytochrome c553